MGVLDNKQKASVLTLSPPPFMATLTRTYSLEDDDEFADAPALPPGLTTNIPAPFNRELLEPEATTSHELHPDPVEKEQTTTVSFTTFSVLCFDLPYLDAGPASFNCACAEVMHYNPKQSFVKPIF
jgi:hypothetical protein